MQKNCAKCEIFNTLHHFWCIMSALELLWFKESKSKSFRFSEFRICELRIAKIRVVRYVG